MPARTRSCATHAKSHTLFRKDLFWIFRPYNFLKFQFPTSLNQSLIRVHKIYFLAAVSAFCDDHSFVEETSGHVFVVFEAFEFSRGEEVFSAVARGNFFAFFCATFCGETENFCGFMTLRTLAENFSLEIFPGSSGVIFDGEFHWDEATFRTFVFFEYVTIVREFLGS